MSHLLELQNVEVRYGNIAALKNINLSVLEGEIACLIGANGSGKSTLLKAITGLEPLSGGKILFKGEIISQSEHSRALTHRIIAKGITLVPEGRMVFTDMTVLENLEMGAYLQKNKLVISDKIENMFNLFPVLKDRRKQKAGSLSGGEQQMLAVARALMSEPELLLLDEPGLGLAPLIIKDIFETIVRINREEKVTVFLVEQNAKMALHISNKGYVMETGGIVLEDKSENLLQNPRVKQVYLGE